MRFLITNDDGIYAPGIAKLAEAAARYGEVYVAAPKEQCSAMSHRITIRGEMRVHGFEEGTDLHALENGYVSVGTITSMIMGA